MALRKDRCTPTRSPRGRSARRCCRRVNRLTVFFTFRHRTWRDRASILPDSKTPPLENPISISKSLLTRRNSFGVVAMNANRTGMRLDVELRVHLVGFLKEGQRFGDAS